MSPTTDSNAPDAASLTDLVIVGAGPAGCAAAIEATRHGRDVVVIDKASFPRDKCCGDGLTTDALRILEDLGLDHHSVPNWNAVTDIIVRGPNGYELTLPLPADAGQYAAVVPRNDLDNQLVDLARSNGVTVLEGSALTGVDELDDRVVVHTADGRRIEARYLVAADGMWSAVRKQLGIDIGDYRGEWHAFRQYFSNTGPRSQHLVVWFEPDLLPGYAWSFPLPGQRANVGFGIMRDGPQKVGDMGKIWREFLDRPHVREVLGPDAVAEGTHKSWPIPARINGLPTHRGRVLFTGDAIGATDPMTGEGIAQALHTGRLAAEAINDAGPFDPDTAGSIYASSIERVLGRDHRFAHSMQRLLNSDRVTSAGLRLVDTNRWTRRNFARWMFEDYPRAMLFTPDRWHRGMFSGPGAYRGVAPAEASLPSPASQSTS